MGRWFLCKEFFLWLVDHNFDWVAKTKRNTVLFWKVYDPGQRKEIYVKLNLKQLLREVYPRLGRWEIALWSFCLRRRLLFAMHLGMSIKKAMNKPHPSAK